MGYWRKNIEPDKKRISEYKEFRKRRYDSAILLERNKSNPGILFYESPVIGANA